MKIALFSDIHANLPALEACLISIEQQEPDAIYCLGDLVGYNIWPNEVIREIRRRGIPTIAGNYDQGIGMASDDCGCAYKTEEDKEMGKISISYTNEMIGMKERQYLNSLPASIRLRFELNKETLNILLVHGSPRKVNEYLFEDREEKSMLRIIAEAEADILCFGHTHLPYHRIIRGMTDNIPRYRHAINIGSVGKPKDGNPQGSYVLLDINKDSSTLIKDGIRADCVRFDYDIERAAKSIEQSPLPDEYAHMLRRGK